MYLVIPTTLVCILFCTAIPTSPINFIQLFFMLVLTYVKLLVVMFPIGSFNEFLTYLHHVQKSENAPDTKVSK